MEAMTQLRRRLSPPAREPELGPGCGVGTLADEEVERPAGRLVVEEDSRGGMQPVAAPVATRDEVPVGLRDAVRSEGGERRLLCLRHLDRLAEDLARRGL